MQAERTINSLKSITGNLTMDPLEIEKKKHFKDFYELIYKSECTENRKSLEHVSWPVKISDYIRGLENSTRQSINNRRPFRGYRGH